MENCIVSDLDLTNQYVCMLGPLKVISVYKKYNAFKFYSDSVCSNVDMTSLYNVNGEGTLTFTFTWNGDFKKTYFRQSHNTTAIYTGKTGGFTTVRCAIMITAPSIQKSANYFP